MKHHHSLILATDLDGTFLGGSQQEKQEFYEYLETQRHRILLVYVTGREIDWISNFLTENTHIPKPDYIIGDVGTTVVNGATFAPISAVQDWIVKQWGNANEQVKQLLGNEPGLKLQAVNPHYRVSYYYDPEELQDSTIKKVIDAGFDCIISAYKSYFYFDVMPKGVSKGPTLLKFLAEMNYHADDTIACGDTLNDFSLFETGLKGIAVGNSHPALVEKIQTMENVYYSPYPGVMGIWDGLKVYGKH
ncbi:MULTISPECIES: HAD-IIB family hydrolase [Nostoc]|uniref:HAD-IIB family hydrolase n=1 Tax=Nostoc paludosum FACHB-159 TaxID=2692908 RepID=A0ABR8K610_9NOSO|nr:MULTISPECIES: HAD-IIB family hydrolase [Nostoc]MBD2677422.1 HAD-IIB family hydrolase [Nostoc sp. FACHB-857]MBD2734184.1 HAD-IIB family hydrolase [Nostoc paludosum FACHB-159]